MHKRAIIIAISAVGLAAVGYGAWWAKTQFGPVQDGFIRAQVQLVNSCPVPNRYFAARSTKTRKQVRFSGDKANIVVRADEKLELILDPKFSAVKYSGYKVPVSAKMILSADCSSSARQKMIVDTMRKRFNE